MWGDRPPPKFGMRKRNERNTSRNLIRVTTMNSSDCARDARCIRATNVKYEYYADTVPAKSYLSSPRGMKQNLFVKEIPCISSFIAHDISPWEAGPSPSPTPWSLPCSPRLLAMTTVSRFEMISFRRVSRAKSKDSRWGGGGEARIYSHGVISSSSAGSIKHVERRASTRLSSTARRTAPKSRSDTRFAANSVAERERKRGKDSL